MKVLVTGITGLVGTHLAEHLLAQGDRVWGCSQHAHWHDDTPPQLRESVELLAADLRSDWQPEFVERVTDFAPDCLYHMGALSVPVDCGDEEPTASAIATNVEGTRRILNLAAELPGTPRVVVASSSHVYGKVSEAKSVVAEDAPCQPNKGYGRSKLLAERVVQKAADEQGVDAIITRAFQHSGPRQSPRMMLPEWCRQFAINPTRPIYVHCLNALSDVTDVRDVVRAYRALAMYGASGEIYNVGSGVSVRSGDLVRKLCEAYGEPREIVEVYPQHQQNPIADISKLVDCSDWQPEISMEQMVRETLAYWMDREQSVR